ncbi:MAG TPA: glycosyltransferase [Terriglobales bacterium]|nr:glycosyltransferase [Terriglobales bacterium]
MKIVIFGLTVSSSWGNGHATIWRGLCGALARQGHQVTFFERDMPYYAKHRDLKSPEEYELLLYQDWSETEPSAREAIDNSDASIVTSYCPDALAASDLVLNSHVPVRVFYDLDSPVTLEKYRKEGSVEYIPSYGLNAFDLVLSYAGGSALKGLKQLLGARRVAALYGSVDPDIHKPVDPNEHYSSDISYLGTYAPDRQSTLDELFLEPARRSPCKRFVIGGAQYPENFPWTENIWFVHHLPPPEHPAFYCSSKLTLNVTRAAMAEAGYCPSGRLFEAAACETPVVSDVWEGLEEFFQPGQEILLAATASDVVDALAVDSEDLRRIGRAARERVLSEHTAEHRSKQLVRFLEAA